MNRFERNLSFFSRFAPEVALLLQETDTTGFSFTTTDRGELNLSQGEQPYHDPKGALEEARRYVAQMVQGTVNSVLCYGLGLGYYYDALHEWLCHSPLRRCVFFEDDPAVLRLFLESPRAERLLRDPQVVIIPIPNRVNDCVQYLNRNRALMAAVAAGDHVWIALPFYWKEKAESFCKLLAPLEELLFGLGGNYELSYRNQLIIENFYQNLRHLPCARLFSSLENSFSHIPAIIFGAGSSLEREMVHLDSLQDKALFFAPGTSMNVLTGRGLSPHFGGGVDPSEGQASRVKASNAFMTPYSFVQRFAHDALDALEGPLFFIDRGGSAPWAASLLAELGICIDKSFAGGVSTTGFCAATALLLGADPLLFVGVDMAYTQGKKYADGVSAHAGDSSVRRQEYSNRRLNTMEVADAKGNVYNSSAVFLLESYSFGDMVEKWKNRRFFYTSLEGQGIPRVEKKTLIQVAQEELQENYDLINLVHAAIIAQPTIGLTQTGVYEQLEAWLKRFLEAHDILKNILHALEERRKALLQGQRFSSLYPGQVVLWEVELEATWAYQHVLFFVDRAVAEMQFVNKLNLSCFPDPTGMQSLLLLHTRFVLFSSQLKHHIEAIRNLLGTDRLPEDMERPVVAEKLLQPWPEGIKRKTRCYMDGALQEEWGEKEGVRYGPCRHFAAGGALLAEGYFVEGKREGRMRQYYPSGALYSDQTWSLGKREGVHRYYFEGGQERASLPYRAGLLEGKVAIYYANGQLKRSIEFLHGVRHGVEQLYRVNGQLAEEGYFEEGKPAGTYQSWYPDGKQKSRVVSHKDGSVVSSEQWDEKGQIMAMDLSTKRVEKVESLLEALKKLVDGHGE